jgi:hypothetical protein
MNTEQKKKLLADVRNAARALSLVVDSGHNLDRVLNKTTVTTIREQSLATMSGLAILAAKLEAEIGTDNL